MKYLISAAEHRVAGHALHDEQATSISCCTLAQRGYERKDLQKPFSGSAWVKRVVCNSAVENEDTVRGWEGQIKKMDSTSCVEVIECTKQRALKIIQPKK